MLTVGIYHTTHALFLREPGGGGVGSTSSCKTNYLPHVVFLNLCSHFCRLSSHDCGAGVVCLKHKLHKFIRVCFHRHPGRQGLMKRLKIFPYLQNFVYTPSQIILVSTALALLGVKNCRNKIWFPSKTTSYQT